MNSDTVNRWIVQCVKQDQNRVVRGLILQNLFLEFSIDSQGWFCKRSRQGETPGRAHIWTHSDLQANHTPLIYPLEAWRATLILKTICIDSLMQTILGPSSLHLEASGWTTTDAKRRRTPERLAAISQSCYSASINSIYSFHHVSLGVSLPSRRPPRALPSPGVALPGRCTPRASSSLRVALPWRCPPRAAASPSPRMTYPHLDEVHVL